MGQVAQVCVCWEGIHRSHTVIYTFRTQAFFYMSVAFCPQQLKRLSQDFEVWYCMDFKIWLNFLSNCMHDGVVRSGKQGMTGKIEMPGMRI